MIITESLDNLSVLRILCHLDSIHTLMNHVYESSVFGTVFENCFSVKEFSNFINWKW